MIHLLADENLNNDIIRGLSRRNPSVVFQRVQDVELEGIEDPEVLQWAAERGYLVVTHDVNTMIGYANNRILRGLIMPGLIVIIQAASVGVVIDDLMLLVLCSEDNEWDSQIIYLPFPS